VVKTPTDMVKKPPVYAGYKKPSVRAMIIDLGP
jgi:hypothetical protein